MHDTSLFITEFLSGTIGSAGNGTSAAGSADDLNGAVIDCHVVITVLPQLSLYYGSPSAGPLSAQEQFQRQRLCFAPPGAKGMSDGQPCLAERAYECGLRPHISAPLREKAPGRRGLPNCHYV